MQSHRGSALRIPKYLRCNFILPLNTIGTYQVNGNRPRSRDMADSAEPPEGEEGNQGISLKALSLEQLRQIKDGLAEVRAPP